MSDLPPIIEIQPTKEKENYVKRKSNISKNPYSASNRRARGITSKTRSKLRNTRSKRSKVRKGYGSLAQRTKEFAIANISKAENFRTNYRSYNNRLNIDYDIIVANEKELPVEPEREHDLLRPHEYREQKEEITNAIRILKMTDEEVVNTSTYNAVARYL
jgi:hypothetical protein